KSNWYDAEERTLTINSMDNFPSSQFGLQVRKQHHRILRTLRISLPSGLIVAIAVPAVLNAANLSLNPSKIAKDNGIVILVEQSAKPAPKARLNVDSDGVILEGYDPVAYFTRHQAVKGNPAIQTRFGGATYYFVSVADKVAFSKDPSKYVPQYGGFCAHNLTKGEFKDSDPTVFLIYKGKLYICSDVDGAKEFRRNIDQNIRKADDYWVPSSRAQGQPYSRYGPR
ncbi:MAG TPA: YHS domain-containing (seleno)protein, partial [Chthoniobacterales bacterium]